MSSLLQWLERVTQVVEQDGAACSRIRLLTVHDGQTWNSWARPFPQPADLDVEVQAYLRSLENEWPTRTISIVFVAETSSGETIAQLPSKVIGKSKSGAVDTATAASAVVFDNLALTIEKLQRLVNVQLDAARRTAEADASTIEQMAHVIRLYREKVTFSDGQPSAFNDLLKEHAPDAIKLLCAIVESKFSASKPS